MNGKATYGAEKANDMWPTLLNIMGIAYSMKT